MCAGQVVGLGVSADSAWVHVSVSDAEHGLVPASYVIATSRPDAIVLTLFPYTPLAATVNNADEEEDELAVEAGVPLLLLAPAGTDGWCLCAHPASGRRGLVPAAYIDEHFVRITDC